MLSFMFTGIVETTAPVLERTDARLTLARPAAFDDGSAGSPQAPKIGSSIAVNGTCLTIVEIDNDKMSFDVVGETWRRTNLGELLVGNTVNLERAMPANGRFEGHVVQGHVEGVATVKEWKTDGQWKVLVLEVPHELLPYITEKGSIALDGVSLTVAGLQGNIVSIALIPYTLDVTTLGSRQVGDRMNVETDILAHYVVKNQSK